LICCVFVLLYLFNNLIDLCPLQAFIAIGLVSRNFYFIRASSRQSKDGNKVSHFCHCGWRMGYRELPASAGLGSFIDELEREVLKSKIMGNGFFFIFVFYTISLKQFDEEI
jgi:hypothetical protein